MTNRLMLEIACLALGLGLARPPAAPAAEPPKVELFAKPNLVAWCIVPFDSKKRGPEERAAMLEKLGFSKFAYDYRAEHIPTFDAEIEALKRHKVELTAWWFPTSLNDEAKMTLAVFEKHKVTPQLWVTGGGGPTKDEADQRARVIAEAGRIRPIAEAAAKVGCQVALYNHGGWFGEPENQIEVIKELKLDNVGIVYNQHHGHDHLARFPELLQKMKPHLLCLNLNGMTNEGDRKGQKIVQLGEGDLDLKLLKVVRDSGYTGPIGILGHTQDDAEERLHDNLDGLDWLLPQLQNKPAGPKPKMRTPVPAPLAPALRGEGPGVRGSSPTASSSKEKTPHPNPLPAEPGRGDKAVALVEGKFGKALDGRSGGALVKGRDEFRQFPLTVECWTKLDNKTQYNILVAHEQKSSGTHWELFTMPGGAFTVYLPGFAPDHCRSDAMLCDDKWHHVAMILELERVRLFVDGKQVADQKHKRSEMKSVPGELGLATLIDRVIGCTGPIDEVRISKGVRVPASFPDKPFAPDESTVALWHLDELAETKRLDDASNNKNAALLGDARVARPESPKGVAGAASNKIDGHWGTDAVGFNWTEADSRDDRFGQMDVGPFLSTSLGPPLAPAAWHDPVYKAIVVRVGSKRQASISYDTELLRATAGWTGFVRFDPARFGIIGAPRPDGPITFVTPSLPGWSLTDEFPNFRADHRYGPLPKEVAHYEGLYRHGQRVVLKNRVSSGARRVATVVPSPPSSGERARVRGPSGEITRNAVSTSSPATGDLVVDGPSKAPLTLTLSPEDEGEGTRKTADDATTAPSTLILETPWLEETADAAALTRTLLIGPAKVALKMLIADPKARVRLHPKSEAAAIAPGHGGCHVLTVEPHDKPITIKLLIASPDTNEAALDKLAAASPAPEDVLALTQPGPTIWGEPLVTKGERGRVSSDESRVPERRRVSSVESRVPDKDKTLSSSSLALDTRPSSLDSSLALDSSYVVDTITLPFQNPFNALLFCGGHDFLPDGRAAVCTLHGDVWIVDGIDEKLERITWRRFATGLFQPLGVKCRETRVERREPEKGGEPRDESRVPDNRQPQAGVVPSPPGTAVFGGTGERARVRGPNGKTTSPLESTSSSGSRPLSLDSTASKAPLTLTLSPEDGGEGTGTRAATSDPRPSTLDPQPSLFVVGRDQITRLHDLNNDGEADYYENFNNDAHVTMNGHEYVACLEADRAGNLYYAKGNCNSATPHDGCVLRVSADGEKLDVFATGFRNPNGMGMGPHDELTVAPQEGEWTPASGLFVVREGGFYGMVSSHHQATPPTDFIRPLCWFSRRDDNSSGGQVWTTSDKFGPLSNQLLHMSYGQCKLRLIVREQPLPPLAPLGRGAGGEGRTSPSLVSSGPNPSDATSPKDRVPQSPLTPNPSPQGVEGNKNGGSIELPLTFASGIHRGRMNPRDGQLYLTGLKGWVSSAVNDGCFQRVRYVGVNSLPPSPRRGGSGRGADEVSGIDSQSSPLPNPPRRGEGTRQKSEDNQKPKAPLTLTLSPADGGEETRAFASSGSTFAVPIAMQTFHNGIALTFTRELDREAAEDPSSYQLETWNYKWSAAYGSPEYKPSAPGQVGRDEIEPKSATLLDDNHTVFIELPNLKPVDQLAIGYTLLTQDSKAIEQTLTLTLNSIPDRTMPDEKLHRPKPSIQPEGKLVAGISIQSEVLVDVRGHRMFAWSIPADSLPKKPRVEPLIVRATAWLRVPSTGEYRFIREGTGTATVAFHGSKDAQSFSATSAVAVRLKRGLNEIAIQYTLPREGEGRFRLMWESARFPREAVPATSLFRRRAVDGVQTAFWGAFSQGQLAYQKHNCARCHSSSLADQYAGFRKSTPFALRGAPRLEESGRRFTSAWLANWLVDPPRLKFDSTMPALIPRNEPQSAVDLVAYLRSLAEAAGPAEPITMKPTEDDEAARRGSDLFERFGCIACHRFTEPHHDDDWNRVSLHFTRAKFRDEALERFLLAPQRHHATSFMPDFRLSPEEAASLASFIRRQSRGELNELAGTQPGNVERGRRAFEQLKCGQCHTMKPDDKLPVSHLASVFSDSPSRGCLAEQTDANPRVPRFSFNDETRDALRSFLVLTSAATPAKEEVRPADLVAHALTESMTSLRCNACHARDEARSLWPEIVAEEGSGRAAESVPQLTWVGEKLQGPWIEKLLKGEIKQKPRPWLTARMPSFPAYASVIAHGMAAEHGVPFEEPLPKELDAKQIEIGRQLTLRDGGLDCRQCHGVGKEQPRGDASTQIALGINFALARERLRPEFALRQMLDPPRYDPGSRMPRFAPDLRTTAARHIEGGDARKQFEALKQFIWSVKLDE